jgi:hypothetical protein
MSSKRSDSKTGSKDTGKRTTNEHKGKLLYHSSTEAKERVGEKPTDVIEKSVTHSENTLFCKFYEKKNGVATKITVRSSGTGGEYTVTMKKGEGETKKMTHNKKDLMAWIKENKDLEFMSAYIGKEKSLGRPKAKTASKSKSKSKSASKGVAKKTTKKPAAKKASPKSKSKSKSKSKGMKAY